MLLPKDFARVSKDTLIPGIPLGLDLFLYMTVNGTIVHYRAKGDCLTAEECESIKKVPTTVPVVRNTDLKDILALPGGKIQEAFQLGDLTSPETVEAAASILRSIDMAPSNAEGPADTAHGPVLEMLGKAQEVVEKIMLEVGDLPALLAYDKILASSKNLSSDPLTTHHRQVSTLCVLMVLTEGKATPDELVEIATAGLVHDMGLLQTPKVLAEKHFCGETEFNSSENLIYIKHPILSVEMLKQGNFDVSDTVLQAVEFHHENMDGSGFRGRKGSFIPRLARFLRIADDVVGLLNSKKENLSFKEALSRLMVPNLLKYDPDIVRVIQQQYMRFRQEN